MLHPSHPQPRAIQCAEIWGGTRTANEDVCTTGITATIYSSASGDKQGGDIYYFSVCSYDILTRVVLADMRGHGASAAQLSSWLYDLLREYMNSLDGAGILKSLNQKVARHGFSALTTAVVLSFNRMDGQLHYANAGHPPPLRWNRQEGWRSLPMAESPSGTFANLPLGVQEEVHYQQESLSLQPGDRLFLYSDGVTECPNPQGDFYEEHRLTSVLDEQTNEPLHDLKHYLTGHLEAFHGGPLIHDDCTFLCLEVRD
jgi:sigma-B regulation protein RsbU (phosphoserine phosphatase)